MNDKYNESNKELPFGFIFTEEKTNFQDIIIEPYSLLVIKDNEIIQVFSYLQLIKKLELEKLVEKKKEKKKEKIHKSKQGKIFQDPINGEKFRVFEWIEHADGIIRAIKKQRIKENEYKGN